MVFRNFIRIFAANMIDIKEKYRQFKEWQRRPHEVAPLKPNDHECATCGTHYEGNYCPRCGQSSRVGRYSFRDAFLLFLDVWGLGNRGMFRSIRDLLSRPGYMIRDYLSGMQMAYFPPFKMFFLIIAFSVLVDTGFNIKGMNRLKVVNEFVNLDLDKAIDENWQAGMSDVDSVAVAKADSVALASDDAVAEASADSAAIQRTVNEVAEKEKVKNSTAVKFFNISRSIAKWIFDHQTVVSLIWLLVFSLPLYFFFRRSPNYPDIRYSEFFVAMVYISNMMNIITAAGNFFFPEKFWVEYLAAILSIVPLKQLSGYSYMRTFLKVIAASLLLGIGMIIIGAAVFIAAIAIFNQQ